MAAPPAVGHTVLRLHEVIRVAQHTPRAPGQRAHVDGGELELGAAVAAR
jgi:hypothetical protein